MGLIRNSAKVRQVVDFGGIESGNIHPTDIDAVLEFNNRVLILIEVKEVGLDIPIGQRLVLERIVDSWRGFSGREGIVIHVEHYCEDYSIDIPLASCKVVKSYYNGVWGVPNRTDLKEALNYLGNKWNIDKLKI